MLKTQIKVCYIFDWDETLFPSEIFTRILLNATQSSVRYIRDDDQIQDDTLHTLNAKEVLKEIDNPNQHAQPAVVINQMKNVKIFNKED